jgi:hypothetical protein
LRIVLDVISLTIMIGILNTSLEFPQG